MRYNDVLSQLSEQYEHVYYVGVYNDFLIHQDYYLDRTHMNEKGYEKMAQAIKVIYQQATKVRS